MVKYKSLILIVIACLPLIFSSYFLFLKDPPVWSDEYTSLHMAKALLETGKINAFHYGGVPETAAKAGLGFPPLYFITLGVWTNLWGESIEVIRALSLIIGMLCIVTFFFVLRSTPGVGFDSPGVSRSLAFWGALLLAFNVNFAKASRFGRPEIFTLLFILLSWLFLYRYCHSERSEESLTNVRNHSNKLRDSSANRLRMTGLGAFLCAALATASHPMGIIAPTVLTLAIIFSSNTLKKKVDYLFWIGACLLVVTLGWVLTTQESIPGLIKALQLGSLDKMSKDSNILGLLTSGSIWSIVLISHALALLAILLPFVHIQRKEKLFLVLSCLAVIFWVFLQKENYYAVYIFPILILALIFLVLHMRKLAQMAIIAFFLFLNIYLQFFYIDSYTPPQNFLSINNFDYHSFTEQVQRSLPDKNITLFLSSIPDPGLDLKKNEKYTIYQAIDPHYPIDESEYKKTLDQTDYVIFTWFPHEYLAYYVQLNAEKITDVTGGGYTVSVAKLKARGQRHPGGGP